MYIRYALLVFSFSIMNRIGHCVDLPDSEKYCHKLMKSLVLGLENINGFHVPEL